MRKVIRVPDGRIEIYTDRLGKYRWRLFDADGCCIARAPKAVETKEQVDDQIALVAAICTQCGFA